MPRRRAAWQTFRRVILPGAAAGARSPASRWRSRARSASTARSSSSPATCRCKTEITPLLIMTKLEQYDYAGATAIAAVMLVRLVRAAARPSTCCSAGPARRRGMSGMIASRRRTCRHAAQRRRRGSAVGARRCSSASPLLFLGVAACCCRCRSCSLRPSASGVGALLRRRSADAGHAGRPFWLTLLDGCIAVPLNVVFGVAAAWAIARFDFRGKSALITLIDLPFAVSPVIAGLIFVLLFGAQGLFGPWLPEHDIKIIFAVPGIVLATTVRDLPVRRARADPADAGAGQPTKRRRRSSLGASGWQMFWRVTLPNIRWGAALRRDPVQRARDGRVRRGVGGLRPHPRPDQHPAAARRDSLQRVQLRGRVRGGLAADAAGASSPCCSRAWCERRASRAARQRRGASTSCRIEVRNVSKRFGTFTAPRRRQPATSASGELVALLGPSGSGKTTLLRIIAGLEPPDSGHASRFDGDDATGDGVRERHVGFVFQHYALFRHMTVFENVAFGLRVRPRRLRPSRRTSAPRCSGC